MRNLFGQALANIQVNKQGDKMHVHLTLLPSISEVSVKCKKRADEQSYLEMLDKGETYAA